jgi:hypothetical protein
VFNPLYMQFVAKLWQEYLDKRSTVPNFHLERAMT